MNEPQKSLKIESPCHMKWGELKGSGPRRWCDQCALHVVDGSAMTKEQATDLVEASDERVCMRVVKDDQGRVVHADSGVASRILRYGLTAAAGVLAACSDKGESGAPKGDAAAPGAAVDPPAEGATGQVEPHRPAEILGEVCYDETLGGMMVAPQEEAPTLESEEDPAAEGAPEANDPPVVPLPEIMGRMRVDEGPGVPPKDESDGE